MITDHNFVPILLFPVEFAFGNKTQLVRYKYFMEKESNREKERKREGERKRENVDGEEGGRDRYCIIC